MNWRRGLLLAGIHLAVAGSLLAWEESGSWRYIKSGQFRHLSPKMILVAFQEEEMIVPFNPCDDGGFVDGEMSPMERVSGMANLPVALLTGWHTPCKSQGYLGSAVESLLHRTRTSEIVIVAVLCALVALEWLLVGGFPLIQPRRWWLEHYCVHANGNGVDSDPIRRSPVCRFRIGCISCVVLVVWAPCLEFDPKHLAAGCAEPEGPGLKQAVNSRTSAASNGLKV